MGHNDQAWPVFRCSLLSPLVLGEIPVANREAYFFTLAQEERLLPNGKRKRISVRTLRRWWHRLQHEGVQGTARRPRNDRGRSRQKSQPLLERAVELKKEQPRRSAVVLNRILLQEFGRAVPRSTLYRHLRLQGATRRKLGISQEKIRCRWTRDQPDALWVGDFADGPLVIHQGEAVRTYLSAWIDCHSRYVVEARYYLRENFDVLIDSLLRAWSRYGTPREIYVDNAKIYHADALKLACTELHTKLLHRPPRDPPAGGLIERFIQTLQGQLEAEIRAAKLFSLGDINRVLQAWLTQEYHAAVNSQTGQSPAERYETTSHLARPVRLESIVPLFYTRVQRTVDEIHSDVSIDRQHFAVDPAWRGDRVEVRYDPFQTEAALQEAQLYRLDGVYLGVGRLYQREKGYHPQPTPPAVAEPIAPVYLDALLASQEASHQARRQAGLDFASAQARNVWSLTSFATCLARLLGRTGGLSALSAEELEALRAFHTRHDRVTERLLRTAVAQATASTIPHVLWQLQSLLSSSGDS
jgi:putative transposase